MLTSFLRIRRNRKTPHTQSQRWSYRPRIEGLERRDVPSTYLVTNTANSGAGSFAAALAAARNGDAVTFDPSVDGGTITPASATYALTFSITVDASALATGITFDLTSGASFSVATSTSVQFNGPITLANASGIAMNVHGNLTVSGLTFANDAIALGVGNGAQNVAIDSATFTGNSDIFVTSLNLQTFSLTNSTVAGNTADDAIDIEAAKNAGLQVILTGDTFTSNTTHDATFYQAGGASLFMAGDTFTGNTTTFEGTIDDFGIPVATIDNSWIMGNTSGNGTINYEPAIGESDVLGVTNSTIDGNVAGSPTRSVGGGGISFTVAAHDAQMDLYNDTIYGNLTYGQGGGVLVRGGTTLIQACTIANNQASNGTSNLGEGGNVAVDGAFRAILQIDSDIIAGGMADTASPDLFVGSGGTLTSQGYNLIGNADGVAGLTGTDQFGSTANPLDPQLNPPGIYNGGTLPTPPPVPGGPADGMGDPSLAGMLDENGVPRAANPAIGAAEPSLSGGPTSARRIHGSTTVASDVSLLDAVFAFGLGQKKHPQESAVC